MLVLLHLSQTTHMVSFLFCLFLLYSFSVTLTYSYLLLTHIAIQNPSSFFSLFPFMLCAYRSIFLFILNWSYFQLLLPILRSSTFYSCFYLFLLLIPLSTKMNSSCADIISIVFIFNMLLTAHGFISSAPITALVSISPTPRQYFHTCDNFFRNFYLIPAFLSLVTRTFSLIILIFSC